MAASEQSRELILARIKAALREPAHAPSSEPISYRQIYAVDDDVIARFVAECTANLTECRITQQAEASAAVVAEIIASLPAGPVFAQDTPVLRAMAGRWGREVSWSSAGGPPETSQACVTLCEALVAQTGSVLVSSATGGRGASVVAPVHIVVAREEQLAADLETALRQAYERGVAQRNSFVGLVTGSSRTADIEKILVQGAHGPRKVVVVLERPGD